VLDHCIGEFAALDLLDGRVAFGLHQALEIVRDGFGLDGAVHALDDEVGGLGPAHVAEHHFAAEDDGAGVDLVEVGVFGGGAVGGFEDGVASGVVDVGAGGDADAADLGGEGVAEVVAVEVHGGG
jgi:hypothetical protein